MANEKLEKLTNEELLAKLKTIKTLQITTATIFIIIILVWILFGYWRTNLPVFISTLAMALGLSAAQYASRSGIRAEISQRQESKGE